MELVGEADNGEEAIAAVDRLQPDVVVMDIRMPALDGIAATRFSSHPRFQVKVMPSYVHRVLLVDDYVPVRIYSAEYAHRVC